MADDIERLILEMSTDLKRFEKGLDRANSIADKRLSAIERRAQLMNSSILKSTGAMTDNLRNLLAAIGVGQAVKELATYADAWTSGANKIAAAGVAMERVQGQQEALFASAQRSRTAIEGNFDAFAKIRRSTEDLGATDEQVARSVEILSKAFKAGGASANEQASALLQLGQALGSGVLQGDELRSIRENSPILAKAIAKEFGTTIAGLKKLGEEGKLTSDKVFSAILKGGRDIEAQFARTTPTIGDSFTVLQNAAIQYVADLDRATGASKNFGNFIRYVAENLDLLVHAAAIAATVVGGALAGQAILLIATNGLKAAQAIGITTAAIQAMGVRTVATTAAVRTLNAALALAGGPIGVFLTAAAIAAAFFTAEALRAARVNPQVTKSTEVLTAALDDYASAASDASVATGKERIELEKVAKAKREAAIAARDVAKANLDQAAATLAAVLATQAQLRQSMNMPTVVGSTGAGNVQAVGIAQSQNDRRDAEASAAAAKEAYDNAVKAIARIDKLLESPPNLGGNPPTNTKANKGRSVAEIALAARIDVARVSKNEELAQQLEDQVDLLKRAREYEDAGLKADAAKVAAYRDLSAMQAARTAAQEKERAIMSGRADLDAASSAELLDQVRTLERAAEIRDRIRDYQDTGLGIEKATAAAMADQKKVDDGRAAGLARYIADQERDVALEVAKADLDHAREESLQHQADLADRVRGYQEKGLNLVQATAQATADLLKLDEARTREKMRYLEQAALEREATLAATRGQEELARRLERQRELQRRSQDYQTSGGLTPEAADARARSEISEEAYAEAQGRFRDVFRNALTSAVRAGDVGASVAAVFDAGIGGAVDKLLDQAANSIFDFLAKEFPKLFDVGQDLLGATAASATIGGAVVASGTTAATAMGAAIVTAGTTAAGVMATAIAAAAAGSSVATAVSAASTAFGVGNFAGGRAAGGPVIAGRRYVKNERGPEPFVPTTAGVVFSTQAMKGLADLGRLASQGGMGGRGDLNVQVVNGLGVPAKVSTERTPDGAKVSLVPLGDELVDGQGRSGKLAKALRKTPSTIRRG